MIAKKKKEEKEKKEEKRRSLCTKKTNISRGKKKKSEEIHFLLLLLNTFSLFKGIYTQVYEYICTCIYIFTLHLALYIFRTIANRIFILYIHIYL